MYVENKLLSKLYKDKNAIKIFREKNITHHLFYDIEIKKVIKYIIKFYNKYKEIPSKDIILNKFNIELEKCKDPVEYYCDKLIEHYIENKQKDLLLNVASNVSDNPLETIEHLRKEISHIDFYSEKRSKILDMGTSTEERARDYFERKRCGGVTGHLTPWDDLTDVTGGINSKELWAIAALTSVGKTWLLCIMANTLREQGVNLLFASQEMASNQIARRIDAIEFKLNYENFRKGQLTKPQEQKYLKAMLSRKKKKILNDIKIAESNTLLDLSNEIKEHKINCLIIDGGYLLNEGNSNNITENITLISRKLKTFSKKEDIPVIVTWQFAKSSESAGTPSLSHFNWSYAIAQNSDIAIGMQCKENMRSERKRKIVLMKDREGELMEFIINFDLECMDFSIDEEYTKNECHPEQDQEDDVNF